MTSRNPHSSTPTAVRPVSPASTWRTALSRLRGSWQIMLGIHLTFVLLGFIVFAPLVGITGRLLVGLSGESAVADQDIARFLLSPIGLAALVLFAALLVGILVFEQSAMLRVTLGVSRSEAVRLIDALRFMATRAPVLLRFSAHFVARVLIVVLPFGLLGVLIANWLIADYDINYYLAARPPEFVRAAILIGLVLLIMAFILVRKLIDWSLALPLLIFDGTSPGKSFRVSTRAAVGRRLGILGSLLLWTLSSLAFGAIVLGGIRLIGAIVVPPVAGDLSLSVIVLLLLALALTIGNFFVTTVTSAHFAGIITLLHERLASPRAATAVPTLDTEAVSVLTPARIAAGLVVAAAVSLLSGSLLLVDIHSEDDVTVIAHRGAAGRAPENTLASVQAAIEDRADWIEIDVQETIDGEVVVVHDSDFMKLARDPTRVWEATVEQLADIDIGSWFGTEFADERVPTLSQVLQAAKGRAGVIIELKYYGHDESLEERVAAIVEETGSTDSVAIMSLEYPGVRKMKSIRPEWSVGLLSAAAIGDLSQLDADFLAVSSNMATSGFIRRAHNAGKSVYAWTVNDAITMSQVISKGVDGIITDEPAMAREVLEERAEMNPAERLLVLAAMFFGKDFTAGDYRDESP